MKVVVVGGGVAGLAAAFELEQARCKGNVPIEYVLLEESDRLGGKIITDNVEGFLIEGGPDSFVINKQGVLDFVLEVGKADRLLPTSREHSGSYVWSKGRLHRLPEGLMLMVPSKFTPFLFSSLISWPGKIRMAMDLFIPRKTDYHEESLEQFVTRRLGREALEKIAEPLVAGIHAASPETMSVAASFPRFLQMEKEHGSLIRAALAARRRGRPTEQGSKSAVSIAAAQGVPLSYFMSFRNGMTELTDMLSEQIPAERVRFHAPVKQITTRTSATKHRVYRVEYGDGREMDCDAVIVTTPAYVTSRLLEQSFPQVAQITNEIKYSATASVTFAYRRQDVLQPLPGTGFVVPSKERRRIMGVTFTSQKWAGRVPDANYVLLRAFVGGAHNQALVHASEADIVRAARSELQAMLGLNVEPLMHRTYVWRKSMPQYTLGHLDRIRRMKELLAEQPGLFVAGAAYEGIGLNDCMRMGRAAARQALSMVQSN